MRYLIGYEGLYSASKDGRIWSHKTNRYLKPNVNVGNGYLSVTLRKDLKSSKAYIHRLVAECFLENYSKKLDVAHLNGIRSDNKIENLKCVDRKENMSHAISHGTTRWKRTGIFKKTSVEKILRIKEMLSDGIPVAKIYKAVGVRKHIVDNIKFNKQWEWV